MQTDLENNTAKVFLPSGGPDPETDQLESWVDDVKLTSIISYNNLNLDSVPLRKSEGSVQKLKKVKTGLSH